MSQDTEQKDLPASGLKLKKQREKGRIAKSPDMYSAVAGVVGFTLFALLLDYQYRQITRIFDASAQAVTFDWQNGWPYASQVIFNEGIILLAPIVVAILLAIIIANLIYNKGIPFSFDPIQPKFEKLNPVEGFKRIFGRRGLIDGAQKVVRLIIWLVAAFAIIWTLMSGLINAPICGYACTLAVGEALAARLIAAAILIMIILALIDMPVQQALFMVEMKMGQSEKKREDKDQYGSPEIRSERKRLHRELLNSAGGKVGIEHATFVIVGDDNAVAVRYVADEEGVPFVVGRALGNDLEEFLEKADGLNLSKVKDKDLANKLSKVAPGSHVPQEHFNDLAMAMVKSGNV